MDVGSFVANIVWQKRRTVTCSPTERRPAKALQKQLARTAPLVVIRGITDMADVLARVISVESDP
jgi:hypothetical protein